ncbi:MAG: N-acetylmuramoyl-L-alanine amidase [Candidatus Acidiferrales bacterium]
MKRFNPVGIQSATAVFLALITLIVCPASSARPDRKMDAREQFERAVRLRTTLESTPQRDRSLADYKQTVTAYQKVYLISPQAEEVTPSLIAEGELYQEMGRRFDSKYFKSAVDTYNFLLKQYPGSRYRAEALFSVGKIQKDNLDKPDYAEATFKEFLKRFPKSPKADGAREALKEIADAREDQKQQQEAEAKAAAEAKAVAEAKAAAEAKAVADAKAAAAAAEKNAHETDPIPAIKGQIAEQRETTGRTPHVTDIRTWNAEDHTRIVVTLEDTVMYNAVRIASPDRIYFDIHKANLTPALAKKTITVDNGLLKSVRLAQNKLGVVRLVLDVDGAKDYSAFLLSKPYRLVIDIRTGSAAAAAAASAKNTPPAPAAPAAPAKNETAKSDPKPAAKAPDSKAASADNRAPAPATKPAAKAAPGGKAADSSKTTVALQPPTLPKPNRDGQRSLTRELGLKISRIVIDPGHGGHDTGTIGPHGLMEKDLCLDVALRLGHLIEEKLPGAEVIYTRKDDTFIPLEQRTTIANDAKADLFVSIHANSSHDQAARGIETYYLNFSTSAESMEVATRENALSQSSLHDLQDIIKKIARNEKIEESKELANDIQDSLTHRMQLVGQNEKNRGVKKAPFIVLIGANMPSVLSEISFISNPYDERLLRKGDQRQRVADGLFRGISSYLENLNSLSYDKSKLISDNRVAAVASGGNTK